MALDLRGHGRSFKPDSLGNWAKVAEDVEAFVAAWTGAPLLAVGHSMGGFVLARVAALLPEAFKELILVDPVILSRDYYCNPPFPAGTPASAHPVSRRRSRWESVAAMIAHFEAREPYVHWQPQVLADYCRYGLLPAADGDGLELACPAELEASAYLGNAGVDPYLFLADVQCPVTVLRGRNGERTSAIDFSISPTVPDLASHFPKGRDMQWTDLSHFIPMEAPDRLAALIKNASQTAA